jgi:hypothetical protein
VDEFLRLHQPSNLALQRAKHAGINLAELKETNPQHYKILVAQNILEVSATLEQAASSVIVAAFRHHEVFRLERGEDVTLLIFPDLNAKETERLETALAKLAGLPHFEAQHVYFRVIADKNGEHRQLALPLPASQWAGQQSKLIGPFANQLEAEAWGEQNVRLHNLIHDTVQHAGIWFCDVFSAD